MHKENSFGESARVAVADMMRSPDRYGFVQVNAICRQVPACAEEKYDESLKIANE